MTVNRQVTVSPGLDLPYLAYFSSHENWSRQPPPDRVIWGPQVRTPCDFTSVFEGTGTGDKGMFRKLNHRLVHYPLLISLSCFLFTINLGSSALWDVDEGKNAEAAREMMDSGNWVVPTFNYELRTDKPVLLYWLQIASYQCFGIDEFAARLPSALAGIVTIMLTYEMGRRMFDARTGFMAGFILASTIAISLSARFANPDSLLNACMTMTLCCFWNSYARSDRAWLILGGVAAGLAVLAKGPIGLLLPSIVVGVFLLLQKQWRRAWDRRFLIGTLLFLLVAIPWYALVGAETKGEFLVGFLGEHNLARFSRAMEEHRAPAYYYFVVLCLGLGPWSIFLGLAAWHSSGRRLHSERPLNARLKDPSIGTEEAPHCYRFLWTWIAVYFLFFSAARTKLPNYILPMYPAVALLIARFLERWCRGALLMGKPFAAYVVVGLLMIGAATTIGMWIAAGTFPALVPKEHWLPCLRPFAILGVIPVLGAVSIGWFLARKRRLPATVAFAFTTVAFTLGIVGVAMPALDSAKPSRTLAAGIRATQQEPEVRLAAYRFFKPTLVFYCRREVHELDNETDVVNLLHYPVQVYLFLPAAEWRQLRGKMPKECHVVASSPDLYDGEEEVVVTNR